MNTIINKKGNQGFTVQHFNHHPHHFDPVQRDVTHTTLSFMVRFAEVKSCGKKQMTLAALDDERDDMRGSFYSPDLPLYATKEDADAAAQKMYEEVVESLIESLPTKIENQKRMAEDGKGKYWAKEAVINAELLEGIKAGDFPLQIVSWKEWRKSLSK
jgi:hypothetical protein